jgi:MFS family permease
MKRPFLGSAIVAVAFLTLMGAFGLNLTGGQFFTPLNQSYNWDLTTLSLAVSLNMITWGILQPVMGRLIDRFGSKPVLVSSAALMGVAFLLCATITQVWQFFLYYGILTATGFAGCGSMANSVLISQWYVRKRTIMLARSSMGINIGQLVLLPLTGFLIANAGFRTAFVVLGLIMLVIVVPSILIVVKSSPVEVGQGTDGDSSPSSVAKPPQSAPLSEALKSNDFWLTTLGFVSCGYTLYLVTIHLPKYAFDLGGGTALGGQLLGIAAAASTVSMWLTGQLSRNFSKKNLLVILYLIRAAAFIWLATSTSIGALYVFAVVYGISSFPIIPLVTGIISNRFGANTLGSILGSAWLLHQVAAAIGVFLGGYLRSVSGDYHLAFWTCTVILAVGTIVTLFVNEPQMNIQRQNAK